MSIERDDGGPAFPAVCISQNQATGETVVYQTIGGATLRDYFMAHAPAEPQPWFQPVMPPCPPHGYESYKWRRELTKQRYIQWPAAWADEMLKARKA